MQKILNLQCVRKKFWEESRLNKCRRATFSRKTILARREQHFAENEKVGGASFLKEVVQFLQKSGRHIRFHSTHRKRSGKKIFMRQQG